MYVLIRGDNGGCATFFLSRPHLQIKESAGCLGTYAAMAALAEPRKHVWLHRVLVNVSAFIGA